jgi:hypothetical protein
MTLVELKVALSVLEVTLSDEISGSLKPWVFLDDIKALKACYPEVVEMVRAAEDSSALSESRSISEGVKRPESSSKKTGSASGKGRSKFISFSFIVMVALVVAGLGAFAVEYIQNSKKSNQPVQTAKPPMGATLYKEIFLRYGENWQNAADFVLQNQGEILGVLLNEPAYGEKLLPYIRLQAFVLGGGYFEGVDSKVLYGGMESGNCRVSEFKKLWKTSEGVWDKVSRPEAWMKPLLTNRNWLQSRWTEGWILPKTFEGACLFLAEDAFLDLYGQDSLSFDGEAIRRRLSRLTAIQLSEEVPQSVKSSHPFDILSCIEDANDEKEIGECLRRNKDKEWRVVFQAASNINRIHRGKLPQEALGKLFPVTQLDLSPELTMSSELKAGQSLPDAIKAAQDQFPQFIKE